MNFNNGASHKEIHDGITGLKALGVSRTEVIFNKIDIQDLIYMNEENRLNFLKLLEQKMTH